MTSNWKAVFGIFLVFAFGCVAGALSASLVIQHKVMNYFRGGAAAQVAAVEQNLTRRLDLDPDQRQKVDAAFQENLQERMSLQAQIRPEIQMANLKTFQAVKAVLRPDQAEQFRRNLVLLHQRLGPNAFNQGKAVPGELPVAGTPPAAGDDTASPPPAK